MLKQGGITALMRAAKEGHVEIVKLLIGAGVDLNAEYRVISRHIHDI